MNALLKIGLGHWGKGVGETNKSWMVSLSAKTELFVLEKDDFKAAKYRYQVQEELAVGGEQA